MWFELKCYRAHAVTVLAESVLAESVLAKTRVERSLCYRCLRLETNGTLVLLILHMQMGRE